MGCRTRVLRARGASHRSVSGSVRRSVERRFEAGTMQIIRQGVYS
jgi:hypothetical protein